MNRRSDEAVGRVIEWAVVIAAAGLTLAFVAVVCTGGLR